MCTTSTTYPIAYRDERDTADLDSICCIFVLGYIKSVYFVYFIKFCLFTGQQKTGIAGMHSLN